MTRQTDRPSGFVLDLDGVIWVEGAIARGARGFIHRLQRTGTPFVVLTNDCTSSVASRLRQLRRAGLRLDAEHLVTPTQVTVEWIRRSHIRRIMCLGTRNSQGELEPHVEIKRKGPVDAVVVGDLFDNYDRRWLEAAAEAVAGGALLVAMQRNRTWSDGARIRPDNGLWVAGLEYVTHTRARLMGKPSARAYAEAVRRLALCLDSGATIVAVSDDATSDLLGAKKYGLVTALVTARQERVVEPWVDMTSTSLAALEAVL